MFSDLGSRGIVLSKYSANKDANRVYFAHEKAGFLMTRLISFRSKKHFFGLTN